jgi:hypothetical protein
VHFLTAVRVQTCGNLTPDERFLRLSNSLPVEGMIVLNRIIINKIKYENIIKLNRSYYNIATRY